MTFSILIAFLLVTVWVSDRQGGNKKMALHPSVFDSDWDKSVGNKSLMQAIGFYLMICFLLVIIVDPASIKSTGYHQTLGDCSIQDKYHSLFGVQYSRQMYLCLYDYQEEFDLCGYPKRDVSNILS